MVNPAIEAEPVGRFIIVWEYTVREEHRAAFEREYGPDGAWAELFRGDADYLGTDLVRGDAAGEYLTIDRWASRAAFDRFMRERRDAYERLDASLASLTESERPVARGIVEE